MYHYRESGLENVWLVNGYEQHTTSEGPAISFTDIDGLHRTIARALVEKRSHLTAREFRFLRVELGLSQKVLGEIIGASEQAVARWEREITPVPAAEDRLLRAVYREHAEGSARIQELLQHLKCVDEKGIHKLKLKRGRQAWKIAA